MMFSVTFRSTSTRSKRYATEKGAYKAIWNWLKKHENATNFSASIMGPEIQPKVFFDYLEVPYKPKVSKDFLETQTWAILRSKAFEKYGNSCACCGKQPTDGVRLHVDHIKPRSKYPELEACLENLQILCELCNVGKSNLSEKKWR